MSDFSMFSLFTAGLAFLVPFTSAYTQPTGDEPVGNPISAPGLGSIVPVGQPYTVTWQPTTSGTVTLVLLKGPSTNAVPQYPIVEGIANTGTYVWTPATDLEPTTDATGYGIQLIDDATGQYQYTTQFGISNPSYSGSTPSGYGTTTTTSSTSTTPAGPTGYDTTTTPSTPAGYTPTTSTTPISAPTYGAGNTTLVQPTGGAPTGYPPHNGTTIKPTGGYTTPVVTLHTTAAPTTPTTYAPGPSAPAPVPPPAATGGAAAVAGSFAGLVFAAGVAVMAI